MYVDQQGYCAICSTKFDDKKLNYIDHCHTTGKVRGLLCLSCNIVLGHIGDSVDIALKIIKYLTENKS